MTLFKQSTASPYRVFPDKAALDTFLEVAVPLLTHDKRDLFPSIAAHVTEHANPTDSVGFFMALTRRLFGQAPPAVLLKVARFTAESACTVHSDDYALQQDALRLLSLTGAYVRWSNPALVAATARRLESKLSNQEDGMPKVLLLQAARALLKDAKKTPRAVKKSQIIELGRTCAYKRPADQAAQAPMVGIGTASMAP